MAFYFFLRVLWAVRFFILYCFSFTENEADDKALCSKRRGEMFRTSRILFLERCNKISVVGYCFSHALHIVTLQTRS